MVVVKADLFQPVERFVRLADLAEGCNGEQFKPDLFQLLLFPVQHFGQLVHGQVQFFQKI
jgi:hypothetical protein